MRMNQTKKLFYNSGRGTDELARILCHIQAINNEIYLIPGDSWRERTKKIIHL